MRSFFAALGFLTVLPSPLGGDLRRAPGFFPWVGLVLGIILWGGYRLLGPFLSQGTMAVISVLGLAALTRGLHLDGLADSADALLGSWERQRALEIMRDSRVGTFGVLAVVSVLLLKVHLLGEGGVEGRELLLLPVLGRTGVLLPMGLLPYLREEGKGRAFFPCGRGTLLFGLGSGLGLAVAIGGVRGLVAWLAVVAHGFLFSQYLRGRLGGVTGDLLGASVETSEVVGLLALALV